MTRLIVEKGEDGWPQEFVMELAIHLRGRGRTSWRDIAENIKFQRRAKEILDALKVAYDSQGENE